MSELIAESDLRGGRINLRLTLSGGAARPELRILRRRRAYPASAEDGLLVLELDGLYQDATTPWTRVERTRWLITNSHAEGGLLQAEIASQVAGAATVRTAVTVFNSTAQAYERTLFTEVTRVARDEGGIEIFVAPGGGPELSAGRIALSTGQLEWLPAEGPSHLVPFELEELQLTSSRIAPEPPHPIMFETTLDGRRIRTLQIEETTNPDTGDTWRRISVADEEPATRGPDAPGSGLEPGATYYYKAFVGSGGAFTSGPLFEASATATGTYGLSQKLYDLLPAIHRYYDEPSPSLAGTGQLRRFLQPLGAALDHVRGLTENLSSRHDVFEADLARLPHLAQWIGWAPDLTLPGQLQRTDILFAPAIFESVGTAPNVKALVNRMTGWRCELKEFAHNVFLTNATESIRSWELWHTRNEGDGWRVSGNFDEFGRPLPTGPGVSPAAPLTQTGAFDGRPAAVQGTDGTHWLFWHSDRSGHRELWFQRLDGIDTEPRRVAEGAPDDAPGASHVEESPAALADGAAVQLFWSSNRDGAWGIWTRRLTGTSAGPATRILAHPSAEERSPAVVREPGGRIWLFWQSNRRGLTDIWVTSSEDGTTWQPPSRLTQGEADALAPSALLAPGGQLRVFWSAARGDRSRLVQAVQQGTAWEVSDVTVDAPGVRDESPAAVMWNGTAWLFFHSNRGGRSRIWSSTLTGGSWSAPAPVLARLSSDKEPAPLADASGALRLFFRSQRGGERFRSRTLDTRDTQALEQLRAREDRTHYTYDTRRSQDAWYARDAVGLYLSPGAPLPQSERQRLVERARAFAGAFRPATVRFIWFLEQNGTGTFVPSGTDG